tara:strand:+ start:11861 stop:12307 length:447 start_codon:yes stop_codon:yes gene_type:complete
VKIKLHIQVLGLICRYYIIMRLLSSIFTLLIFMQMNSSMAQTPSNSSDKNEDILLSDPYLSVLYQRGAYLIYNCIDGHWVCSGKAEFNSCKETRNEAIKERKVKLPCAPVRTFVSEDDCVAHQASLVNAATENRFCLHPDRRISEIVY